MNCVDIITNKRWFTEVQAKRTFTAEELSMRRAEMARRRRNLSEKRNEEVKVGVFMVLFALSSPHAQRRSMDKHNTNSEILRYTCRWRLSTSCSRSRCGRTTKRGRQGLTATTRLPMKAAVLRPQPTPCLCAGSATRTAVESLCRQRSSRARLVEHSAVAGQQTGKLEYHA